MTATAYDRRAFIGYFSSIGLGSTLLPGVLWAQVAAGAEITPQTIATAEEIAGLSFDESEREMMVEGLKQQAAQIEAVRKVALDNAVAPAIRFDPLPPGATLPTREKGPSNPSRVEVRARPSSIEELAFLPVTELAAMVKARRGFIRFSPSTRGRSPSR